MHRHDGSKREGHCHRAKFTEGLLDNERILETLNVKAGQTVLDAGCGNGYMSKLFSNQVAPSGKVYALDPDKHFINILEDETRETPVSTIVGDITRPTPLDDASIDLLYISTVIHAFSQQQMQAFVREAKRLLKHGALLAIVEIEKKETPFGPPLELRYSPEELKAVVSMTPVKTVPVAEHFYMQVFKNQ